MHRDDAVGLRVDVQSQRGPAVDRDNGDLPDHGVSFPLSVLEHKTPQPRKS
jgi:hypothetical protein